MKSRENRIRYWDFSSFSFRPQRPLSVCWQQENIILDILLAFQDIRLKKDHKYRITMNPKTLWYNVKGGPKNV